MLYIPITYLVLYTDENSDDENGAHGSSDDDVVLFLWYDIKLIPIHFQG